MNDPKQRLALLGAELQARGWELDSPFGLPVAFYRPSIVAPYFYSSTIRAMRGEPRLLRVCGGVGVIHRGFESLWLQDNANVVQGSLNPFPLHLLIDNFLELETDVAILSSRVEKDIASFADAITRFLLSQMPQDEEALARAFASGELCGKSISSFESTDELTARKFDDLRRFLRHGVDSRQS